MISFDKLKSVLDYDPDTGIFRWKVSCGCGLLGKEAGTSGRNGRIEINLGGKRYRAHRLAWLYMTGDWPKHTIDHIDRDASNNKFANLRDVTMQENLMNRADYRKISDLPKGVFVSRKKYGAQIWRDGRRRYLGLYSTIEEASRAFSLATG